MPEGKGGTKFFSRVFEDGGDEVSQIRNVIHAGYTLAWAKADEFDCFVFWRMVNPPATDQKIMAALCRAVWHCCG
ncbi:hypothetical protein AA18895_2391 [Acetobacter ghanensis DSM 18895]|nr:hypothetical protein AA18895_2391 [Acetobacter ghanensis DSM 18895]